MMNIDWLIGTAEARINRFLRNNAIDIPDAINNSVLKIELPQIPFIEHENIIYCHLYKHRTLLSKQASDADVAITIHTDALIALAKGEKLAALLLDKKIQMHGDIGKAHALQHWIENLSLTKEDAFAEVFGDTLGPLLASLEQQAEPLIANILTFGKNIVTQLSANSNNDDNMALKQQIIRLREQADRLEARVQNLNDELQRQKGLQ